MAVSEAVARLEAKLRGWQFVAIKLDWWRMLVQKSAYAEPEVVDTTNPATPEGAWEWVRLLDMGVGWRERRDGTKYWFAFVGPAFNTQGEAPDPVAAVAAAVAALAATGDTEQAGGR